MVIESRNHSLLWSRLKRLLNRNECHKHLQQLQINGKELSGVELADAFNNFFTDITRAQAKPPQAIKYIGTNSENTIYLEPVMAYEVVSIIKRLKNSTSCDIDGFQVSPIKHAVEIIAPILAHIFNVCLQSAIFPEKNAVGKSYRSVQKGRSK